MIPALLLWMAMGQQPTQIKAAGSAPAAQHHAVVIAGDGVELKAQPNGDVIAQKSELLKCGKYEHVEFDEEADVIVIPESKHPFHKVPGSERCAPIMHPLKESEYQEIMERLKKLEGSKKHKLPPGVCLDTKSGDLVDCLN